MQCTFLTADWAFEVFIDCAILGYVASGKIFGHTDLQGKIQVYQLVGGFN